MTNTEFHGDANGHEKQGGNKKLRDIKTYLSDRGVNISAAQRPPSQQTIISAFRHQGPFRLVQRQIAATSNFERFQ
jgi:hypothetical protein